MEEKTLFLISPLAVPLLSKKTSSKSFILMQVNIQSAAQKMSVTSCHCFPVTHITKCYYVAVQVYLLLPVLLLCSNYLHIAHPSRQNSMFGC
jgi:hypothetical protein